MYIPSCKFGQSTQIVPITKPWGQSGRTEAPRKLLATINTQRYKGAGFVSSYLNFKSSAGEDTIGPNFLYGLDLPASIEFTPKLALTAVNLLMKQSPVILFRLACLKAPLLERTSLLRYRFPDFLFECVLSKDENVFWNL